MDRTKMVQPVTREEMHVYGYLYDGFMPISREDAIRLWDTGEVVSMFEKGKPDAPVIWRLFDDCSEGIVENRDDIICHHGMFGIERDKDEIDKEKPSNIYLSTDKELTEFLAEKMESETLHIRDRLSDSIAGDGRDLYRCAKAYVLAADLNIFLSSKARSYEIDRRDLIALVEYCREHDDLLKRISQTASTGLFHERIQTLLHNAADNIIRDIRVKQEEEK